MMLAKRYERFENRNWGRPHWGKPLTGYHPQTVRRPPNLAVEQLGTRPQNPILPFRF
jgi:hypothetical protein